MPEVEGGARDEAAAHDAALPLDWMIESEGVARESEPLDDGLGPARLIAVSVGLADDAEIARVRGWLEAMASRAQRRSNAGDEAAARSLLALIDPDWTSRTQDEGTASSEGGAPPGAGLVVTQHAVVAVQSYLRTGDVGQGIAMMDAALSAARAERADGVEAALLPFLAQACIAAGACDRAAKLLRRCAEVRAGLGAFDAVGVEVLASTVEVALLVAQGHGAQAAAAAARAIERAGSDGWARAMTVALCADPLMTTELPGAPAWDPATLHEVSAELVASERAWAVAAATLGAARHLLQNGRSGEVLDVVSAPDGSAGEAVRNALDRARCLVVEAGARAAGGDAHTAAGLAQDADGQLASLGAVRWQIEALLMLGSIEDGDVGAQAIASALELSTLPSSVHGALDAQYEVLWAKRPPMCVEVIGTRRITVGDRPIELGDKAEQLFLSVLLEGPSGAHWETVASWLWPDENEMGKLKSRVSSTTNLARKALGSEAWRLERVGPVLRVNRIGLTCDLDVERSSFERSGTSATAGDALLPGWSELGWVEDLELDRRDRLDQR